MTLSLDRRSFLQRSAVLGGSLLTCSIPLDRSAHAAPVRIDVPVVDEIIVREITDNTHDIFLRGAQAPGLAVGRVGFPEASQGKTLESEWGLALHIQSRKGQQTRRYLLDFGFTPDVYANNLGILKIDVAQVDALIISHGHYDHVGGLMGFLEAQRSRMRKDLRLYTGGEDDFCHRYNRNADGSFTEFGKPLDRRRLRALNVESVLAEAPIVIEGQAFTTGVVARASIEHVLPNTWVEYGVRDGLGCDTNAYMNHHFTTEELAGKPEPDQHWHEHAVCFHLGDRGLVVLTSCGHAGIINVLRRAQEVAGVDKIYALVGGFHLAPAPDDYLRRVMAELKKFELEHVFPMHCSGQNFIDLAKQEMPEKLVFCGTGSSFTLTA
jgi:7,8-dihydropterin-6-yl-methyl-4-(beta-D-ribofuranosyl)aminobenzene 5'-phosphate synthase